MILGRRYVLADPDALAWERAVQAAGGHVSHRRAGIVSDFIRREKAAGAWTLTDDYWLLAAENDVQALVSLKQLRTAVATSAFEADRGYTSDGATTFINTGFIPTTHAVAMSAATCRIASYERTNLGSGDMTAGGRGASATNALWVLPRSGADAMSGRAVSNSGAFADSITDSRGLSAVSRANTTSLLGYKNGIALTPATVSAGAALPEVVAYIGCYNVNGTATDHRAVQIAFVCVGASLSAAQELAQYNNVQGWLQDIGAEI